MTGTTPTALHAPVRQVPDAKSEEALTTAIAAHASTEGRSVVDSSNAAPSHVLVARALGPVAGRAIITERRALLEQKDAAEERLLQMQSELEATRGNLPAIRAREESALDREREIRLERDAAISGAEIARTETAKVRVLLEAERIRAERAEAALEEVRAAGYAEAHALREQLEVTQADWRCADDEARYAERGLAVTQTELRACVERVARAEEKLAEAEGRHAAALAEANERCVLIEAQRNEARQERAATEGERRALEQAIREGQEASREERKTLRDAVAAAEARARLAVGQVAIVEQDRAAVKQELAALRLEIDAQAEAARARESAMRGELRAASSLATDMSTRCRAAEEQSERHSTMLDEALRGNSERAAARLRTDAMLDAERERASRAEGAANDAQRAHYLALHRPEHVLTSGDTGVITAGGADLGGPPLVATSTPQPPMPGPAGAGGAPWWWGTGAFTPSMPPSSSMTAQPQEVS